MPRDFYERDLYEQLILASILPGVAGAMNAVGFFVVGIYTSHMTGLVARIGDELAKESYELVGKLVGFIFAFFLGALLSAALVELGEGRLRGRHFLPLMIEAIALAFFALDTRAAQAVHARHFLVPGVLLCFSMGIQNALVTKVSGAVVRTTHLTGVITDIGIESFHVLRHGARGFIGMRDDPDWARLRIHLTILVSFFCGAVGGPILYLRWGSDAMFLPVVVVVALAIFDVSHGIRPRPATR